jgi:hypothetical protein
MYLVLINKAINLIIRIRPTRENIVIIRLKLAKENIVILIIRIKPTIEKCNKATYV